MLDELIVEDGAGEVVTWADAVRAAAMLLFAPQGLRRFAWYESARRRIAAEVGYDEMMWEAASEWVTQRALGASNSEALQATSNHVMRLWRPLSDRRDYAAARVVVVDWHDELVEALSGESWALSPSAEEEAFAQVEHNAGVTSVVVDHAVRLGAAMQAMSEEQRQLLWAVAHCGSQAEAARMCGVSRQVVHHTVKRARKLADTQDVVSTISETQHVVCV